MANHLYNYASGHSIPNYSSLYTTGSDTNAYDTSLLPSRYDWSSSSSLHSAHGADGSGRAGGMSMYSQLGWGERESLGAAYGTESMFAAGIKRQAEALYHQSALGIHNSMGQSEALFSTNSLLKRSRVESASHLPIYPQRPGEKDCTHYMLTRTCKFGENCKFDHPIWVPEGGIPDWKEVPLAPLTELLPERPGEPDCPYFIKTQKCKFGYKCKFNHPKDQLQIPAETADASILPERPSEPLCTYYAKTGKCKFGANCIFNHPKDLQILAIGQGQKELTVNDGTENDDPFSMRTSVRCTPALLHNTKGLPIRPGEQDCPFYLKTGSCKYGAACRYNHPERTAINLPLVGSVEHTMYQNLGTMNSSASIIPSIDPSLTQAAIGLSSFVYPQRPGEPPCDFYMKTGHCKFAERCKFHHPVDGHAPPSTVAKQASKEIVKLTLAGLPRREGATRCSFYMKTGHCMYGAKCRYDHPPPGEVAATATNQDAVNADGTAATQEKTAIEVEVEQT